MLLNLETVPHFYKNYVKQIEETDLIQALRISGHRTLELVHFIKEEKADYRYAEGKWSVRELLCHMIDAERIFAYRALRFARNDKTNLSGFEENDYAIQANAAGRSLRKITPHCGSLWVRPKMTFPVPLPCYLFIPPPSFRALSGMQS